MRTAMKDSTTPPRRSAALVARVSSGAQSTDRQVEAVREAAARFAPDLPTIEVFESGSAYKTSIFDRQPDLIAAIERGEVEVVIADAQDRLGRKEADVEWVAFRALCRTSGTRIIIDGRELPDDLGGRIEGYLKAELAHQESVEKSHRVRSAKSSLSRRGKWAHGFTPAFYVAVEDEEGHKVLQPAKDAHILTQTFNDAANHVPLNEIRRRLAAQGHPFTRQGLHNLLRNRVYLGLVKCAGHEYEGQHDALVDDLTFKNVQARLDAAATGKQKRQPRRHSLAGVIRCECGRALSIRNYADGPWIHAYCQEEKCEHYRVYRDANKIEANVVLFIGALAAGLRTRLADPTFAVAQETQGTVEQAQARLDEAEADLALASELVLDKALDKNSPRYRQILAARIDAEAELRAVTSQGRSFRERCQAFVDDVAALADAYAPPQVVERIERDEFTVIIDGADDITGERFVARLGAAWQVAPLPERHRLIVEHVLAIECSDEAVGFSFATALPVDTIYLPATDVCARNLTHTSTNTDALLVALLAIDGAFQTTKGDRTWQS